jgi:hypothetical protein
MTPVRRARGTPSDDRFSAHAPLTTASPHSTRIHMPLSVSRSAVRRLRRSDGGTVGRSEFGETRAHSCAQSRHIALVDAGSSATTTTWVDAFAPVRTEEPRRGRAACLRRARSCTTGELRSTEITHTAHDRDGPSPITSECAGSPLVARCILPLSPIVWRSHVGRPPYVRRFLFPASSASSSCGRTPLARPSSSSSCSSSRATRVHSASVRWVRSCRHVVNDVELVRAAPDDHVGLPGLSIE